MYISIGICIVYAACAYALCMYMFFLCVACQAAVSVADVCRRTCVFCVTSTSLCDSLLLVQKYACECQPLKDFGDDFDDDDV